MPRAKKPIQLLTKQRYPKQVKLNPITSKALARRLGISGERAAFMIEAVEAELRFYHERKYHSRITPKSQLAALTPLRDKVNSLIAAINQLDSYSRASLGRPSPVSSRGAWTASDEGSLLDLLLALKTTLDDTLSALDVPIKHGRRKDWSLTLAVDGLFFIFHNFNACKQEGWREFIHMALDAGEINHPDPTEQRFRFDALLSFPLVPKTK